MYYQQDLRVKLQERRNRLYKASHQIYDQELAYFIDFLHRVPYFVGILEELEWLHPDITFDDWRTTQIGWRELRFPDTETRKAEVCYECLVRCAEGKEDVLEITGNLVRGNLDAHVRAFTELFVDPVVNFLHDRVDEGSSMLYLLERYKHKVEWFRREELFEEYQADTSRGEGRLDAHLREFLVDQGVQYPFSTPSSPSGRTDIVAGLQSPDPLVLEVKLFEPAKGYGRAYVRKGLRQVRTYAADYNKPVGYLVVYNLSDHDLVFETRQDDSRWPPRVRIGNSTFFIVSIATHPVEETASQRRELKQYRITEGYLLSNEADDAAAVE